MEIEATTIEVGGDQIGGDQVKGDKVGGDKITAPPESKGAKSERPQGRPVIALICALLAACQLVVAVILTAAGAELSDVFWGAFIAFASGAAGAAGQARLTT